MFNNIFNKSTEYRQLMDDMNNGYFPLGVFGLNDSSTIALINSFRSTNDKQIIIAENDLDARKISDDLNSYYDRVYYYPKREIDFYDTLAHSNQIKNMRLKVISEIINDEPYIIVTTLSALSDIISSKKLFLDSIISLKVGENIDFDNLPRLLVMNGYERVDIVEASGQFSIRGSIVDIFTCNFEHPLRIEFFDTEVDSIRFFSPTTQKSIEKISESKILPAQDVIVTADILENTIYDLKKKKGKNKDKYDSLIENLSSDLYLDHLYRYSSIFDSSQTCLLDYLYEPMISIINSNRAIETFESYYANFIESFKDKLEAGKVVPEQSGILISPEMLLSRLEQHNLLLLNKIKTRIDKINLKSIVDFTFVDAPRYHGKSEEFIKDVNRYLKQHYDIVLMMDKEILGNRIKNELTANKITFETIHDLKEIKPGRVNIYSNGLREGFVTRTFKLAVFTLNEIFDSTKKTSKTRASKVKKDRLIKSFNDLNAGDYVVHVNHGIGKYSGVIQLSIDGQKKDYLKINYKNDDNLYIPIEQMEMLQKYVGAELTKTKLNKLGTSEWKKTKSRVKKSIEDMTDELLELYASRNKYKGFAFKQDTEWQKQFEDTFPYEETPDQLRCIEEIKKDMEVIGPMDRLLCGDVGFGKTEVAIRAVFKAVMDSKQVAILVPTTILAQQHFNNLVHRFSKYPIKIEMLSRFRSKKQQDLIVENVSDGVVDVIIGTHRLLSNDISFKDLGLLIIDEEQRFGVKHKEKIKKLKNNVDVLALTATPIPRTLHMSLIGIRDMSVIEDPPEDRYPVQTYLLEYDLSLFREAIIREVERGGQVFFVHNRVEDIDAMTSKLMEILPDEISINFAHGQMNEHKLEKIMLGFLNKEFDVLVCTTIIETGLDISNVNTIIINNADKMGLSQLYQLRGRVGRSNKVAYCYLTYEKNKVLTEIAERRLKAIKEFTELGSGFKIAMKDLEIRGAGNLLGASQHGHMSTIGYELYCTMLEDAVRKLKGDVVLEEIDTSIDFNINAYLPDRYITDARFKLELYKKISAIKDKDDLHSIEEEIEDRFGEIPIAVYNLMRISYLRALAQKLNVERVLEDNHVIRFYFDATRDFDMRFIVNILDTHKRDVKFSALKKPYLEVNYRRHKLSRNNLLLKAIDTFEEFIAIKDEVSKADKS